MLCKRQTHPTNTMEQQQLLSKAHAALSKPPGRGGCTDVE